MFIVNQPTTTPDQIVYFKSQSDSQRYWNFFVENKDVISPQYVQSASYGRERIYI